MPTLINRLRAFGQKMRLYIHCLFPPTVTKVYQEGMYGPRYQWLFWSGRLGLFYQINDEPEKENEDGCTREQVRFSD